MRPGFALPAVAHLSFLAAFTVFILGHSASARPPREVSAKHLRDPIAQRLWPQGCVLWTLSPCGQFLLSEEGGGRIRVKNFGRAVATGPDQNMTFSTLFDGLEVGYGGIPLSTPMPAPVPSPSSPSKPSTAPSSPRSHSSFALEIWVKNNINLRTRHTLFTGPWRGKNADWSLGTHRGNGVLTLAEFRGRRVHATGVDFGSLPRGRWLRLTIVGTTSVPADYATTTTGVGDKRGTGMLGATSSNKRGGRAGPVASTAPVHVQAYYIDGRKLGETRAQGGLQALQMVGNGGYQMRSPWGMLRNLRVCSGATVTDAMAAERAVQAPLRDKLRQLVASPVDDVWAGELARSRASVVLVGNSEKILRDADRTARGEASAGVAVSGVPDVALSAYKSWFGKGARLGDIIDSHDAVFRFNALDVVTSRMAAEGSNTRRPPGTAATSSQWEATVTSGRSTPRGGAHAGGEMHDVIGQVVTHDVLGDLTQLCGCGNGQCCSPDHVQQLTARYDRRRAIDGKNKAKALLPVHLIYARESQTPLWAKQLRQEGRVRFARLGVDRYDVTLVNLWLDDQADKGLNLGQGKGLMGRPEMLRIRHRLPQYNSFRTGFRVIVALLMRGVVPDLVGFDLNEEVSALFTGGRKWGGSGRMGGERYLPETRVLADLVDAGLLRML